MLGERVGDNAPIKNLALSSEKPRFQPLPKSVPLTAPSLGREGDDCERRYAGNREPGLSSTPSFLIHKPGKSKQSLENIELEPHVSLRHGAPASSLRDIYSRYSLNKCVACVIDAPARIAAATIAASVSIASFAPA